VATHKPAPQPTPGGTLEQVLASAARASSAGVTVRGPDDGALLVLDLDLLDDNPFQPRGAMDDAKLAELASSIAQSGLLQPIAVRPTASGRYHIVAGHRRVAAFKRLRDASANEAERGKYGAIRAQAVLALGDAQMAIAAYVENVQRAELTPVEEAAALARIKDLTAQGTPKEVAARTGQNEQRVRRLLKLHDAPAVVKTACTTGLLVEVGSDDADSSSAPPRRETRRLDLIAALELARLYAHFFKSKPKHAEERTGATIRRALAEGWGFRRIQEYVEGIISGRVKSEGAASSSSDPETPAAALFEATSSRWLMHVARLPRASAAQLVAVRVELERLLAEVDARTAAAPEQAVTTVINVA